MATNRQAIVSGFELPVFLNETVPARQAIQAGPMFVNQTAIADAASGHSPRLPMLGVGGPFITAIVSAGGAAIGLLLALTKDS